MNRNLPVNNLVDETVKAPQNQKIRLIRIRDSHAATNSIYVNKLMQANGRKHSPETSAVTEGARARLRRNGDAIKSRNRLNLFVSLSEIRRECANSCACTNSSPTISLKGGTIKKKLK